MASAHVLVAASCRPCSQRRRRVDLAERRRQFADEVREAIRRIDAIDALVAARHAGLIE